MARVHPIFPSFTTGEVTPLLYGRIDFAKYSSSCRVLYNMLARPHGPAYRRPGTHFVAEVKASANFTRLIPFEFSTTQAYVIEAGNQYFRFYKDGGRIESPPGTPVEVSTPYLSGDISKVKYVQSADTMYFVHPNVPPYKLTRQSHTQWTMAPVDYLPPATYENGCELPLSGAITLTFAATTGFGIVANSSANIFLPADVGRIITVRAPSSIGRAVIRTVVWPPGTQVTVDIVTPLTTVGPFTDWVIEGSPNTQLTPSIAAPEHAIVTLTLAATGWLTNEVGKYVRVNGGVVKVTRAISQTVLEAEILTALTNTTPSPGGSWTLEVPSWNTARGFPGAVAFHEQRLVVGGTLAEPQTFWGSLPGVYESFPLGSDDDDAYEFVIAANKVNVIQWILPTRAMLLGTASSEFVVQGSPGATTAAVGPNSVDIKSPTQWGSSALVAPVRIGSAALFVSRSATELREMLFSADRDAYIANDMLLLADHLTEARHAFGGTTQRTLTDITYQQHPNSTVWCIRSDGALLSLTYQREHDVVGWGRHITGQDLQTTIPGKGKFESVTTIPRWTGDQDVAWVVVNRNINGVQKRFVEYLDDVEGYYGPLGMDCALTYSGAPTNTLTGLSHLNGETVAILGDGAVYPDAVVSGGSITLSGNPVSQAEVGLPFWSMLQTMRPEVPVQGTSQGLAKTWAEIIVRVDKSLGMFINGEEMAFRVAADPMDTASPLRTGDVVKTHDSTDNDGILTIEQRQPLPMTVVAVFGTLQVGE